MAAAAGAVEVLVLKAPLDPLDPLGTVLFHCNEDHQPVSNLGPFGGNLVEAGVVVVVAERWG